jgi:hypothetical protein
VAFVDASRQAQRRIKNGTEISMAMTVPAITLAVREW